MLTSTATGHAIRALTRLAAAAPGRRMLLGELCAGTDLPQPYVGKILQNLVRAKLLHSRKGRGGGFSLARPAAKIALLDIVAAIDGPNVIDRCILGFSGCDEKQPCPMHAHWAPLRAGVHQYLSQTTLAELLTQQQQRNHCCVRQTSEVLPAMPPMVLLTASAPRRRTRAGRGR